MTALERYGADLRHAEQLLREGRTARGTAAALAASVHVGEAWGLSWVDRVEYAVRTATAMRRRIREERDE